MCVQPDAAGVTEQNTDTEQMGWNKTNNLLSNWTKCISLEIIMLHYDLLLLQDILWVLLS